MNRSVVRAALLGVVLLAGTGVAVAQPAPAARPWTPAAEYLTWRRDPTTTMVIHWQSEAAQQRSTRLQWRSAGDQDWRDAEGGQRPFPHATRIVHQVELTDLTPNTLYEYRLAEHLAVARFRTMPATLSRPVRFVDCGDVLSLPNLLDLMNRNVASRDVDFIVFSGDIAQANGDPNDSRRWYIFLDSCTQYLVAAGNRRIPIQVGIGNHEVQNDGFGQTPEQAPYFYSLFALPNERGFGVLDFGKYLSLFMLDSGHTNPVDGEQARWLEENLKSRQNVLHRMATYHVPAWPAFRDMNLPSHVAVRGNWIPLFEKYSLAAAFEHHEHDYKRSHPIRDNKVDPLGVVYLGNGGYAQGEVRRPVSPGPFSMGGRWYLARTAQTNHFILVTLDGPVRRFQAIDFANWVFDEYATIEGAPSTIVMDRPTSWLGAPLWIAVISAACAALVSISASWLMVHSVKRASRKPTL